MAHLAVEHPEPSMTMFLVALCDCCAVTWTVDHPAPICGPAACAVEQVKRSWSKSRGRSVYVCQGPSYLSACEVLCMFVAAVGTVLVSSLCAGATRHGISVAACCFYSSPCVPLPDKRATTSWKQNCSVGAERISIGCRSLSSMSSGRSGSCPTWCQLPTSVPLDLVGMQHAFLQNSAEKKWDGPDLHVGHVVPPSSVFFTHPARERGAWRATACHIAVICATRWRLINTRTNSCMSCSRPSQVL